MAWGDMHNTGILKQDKIGGYDFMVDVTLEWHMLGKR